MYLRQVGVVPILSCMENIELWCVGAVFSVSAMLATVRVVICTAIFPLGYPGVDVTFR